MRREIGKKGERGGGIEENREKGKAERKEEGRQKRNNAWGIRPPPPPHLWL